MTESYDAIIIGSGPAGGNAAAECNKAGLKTAVIEEQGFGGTCPLRGCNPKKILYNATEAVARTLRMRKKGLQEKTAIEWPELMAFKRSLIDPISEKVKASLKEKGIDVVRGSAQFTDRNLLLADGLEYTGKKILIATGAIPRPLDFPGSEHLITSADFLDLDTLPDSFLFTGGGYISFELAQICALSGKQVTILEMGERPLAAFDPDMVDLLVKESRNLGMRIETNMPVHSIEEGFIVKAGQNGEQTFKADCVVHGAGRVPNIAHLNLEAGGIEHDPKGIIVDDYMQSSNRDVYAAGDAARMPLPLTPTANQGGRVAAENIINGNSVRHNLKGVPSIVFSHPPIAAVGKSEAEIREQGLDADIRFKDTSSWFTSRSLGLKHSGVKIILEKKSRKILGAHTVGHHTEEVINLFALAVRHDLTADQLADTVWTYPSATREIMGLLD